MEWKVFEAEPGTSVSLLFDRGCNVLKDGGHKCTFSQHTGLTTGHLEVKLSEPLDESAKLESTADVHVLFVHQALKASCALCGATCSLDFMGHKFESPKMPPCPVPAGSFVADLPFDSMELSKLKEFPFQGVVTMNTRLSRGNGTTVLRFRTVLSI
mmetsp:Transcript_18595/g.43697  ORF Transcript_18595/g.43697 Transcript_18595/m.43697 type:complete len:156 (+) Transcript_18595:328-795(+)